jgi:hypothetical protein
MAKTQELRLELSGNFEPGTGYREVKVSGRYALVLTGLADFRVVAHWQRVVGGREGSLVDCFLGSPRTACSPCKRRLNRMREVNRAVCGEETWFVAGVRTGKGCL